MNSDALALGGLYIDVQITECLFFNSNSMVMFSRKEQADSRLGLCLCFKRFETRIPMPPPFLCTPVNMIEIITGKQYRRREQV